MYQICPHGKQDGEPCEQCSEQVKRSLPPVRSEPLLGLSVHHKEDGCWMRFKASNGREACINLEALADRYATITGSAIRQWIEDVRPNNGMTQLTGKEPAETNPSRTPGTVPALVGTCDCCAHWTDSTQLDGTSRGWGRCASGKHVETGWVTHGDESSLIHHAEGCDCSRSVVQTGPKYGCIHFRSNAGAVPRRGSDVGTSPLLGKEAP